MPTKETSKKDEREIRGKGRTCIVGESVVVTWSMIFSALLKVTGIDKCSVIVISSHFLGNGDVV